MITVRKLKVYDLGDGETLCHGHRTIQCRVYPLGICDHCTNISYGTKYLRCGRCRSREYCSERCQKSDWSHHRLSCTTATADSYFKLKEIRDLFVLPEHELLKKLLSTKEPSDSLELVFTKKQLKASLKRRSLPVGLLERDWAGDTDRVRQIVDTAGDTLQIRFRRYSCIRLSTSDGGIKTHFCVVYESSGFYLPHHTLVKIFTSVWSMIIILYVIGCLFGRFSRPWDGTWQYDEINVSAPYRFL